MPKGTKLWIAAAAVAVLMGIGAGIALASGSDDTPLRGDDLRRATAAALAFTDGGIVTETGVGDDTGAYEVEERRVDGRTVEVHLDRHFRVMRSETDDVSDGEDAD